MAIYVTSGNKLKPVLELQFDLEKDIQKQTEENLEILFGLRFVSGSLNREFNIKVQEQDFYIDTLAFDEQQKSFVIIEYKKDRSFSVIDQGFAYLSAMLNAKADFVLELNEKLGGNFTKSQIDWEQSRLVFISREFTNYQKNAINFKDLPFFLYEVRSYENGMVEFDPVKPFRATESINTFTRDKLIRKVSDEVKVYSIDDLIKPDWDDTRNLYEKLRDKLLAIDHRIEEKVHKQYVAYGIGRKNFVGVNLFKTRLQLMLNRSQPEDLADPQHKVGYIENSMKYYNQHISYLDISSESDIDYAVSLSSQVFRKTYTP